MDAKNLRQYIITGAGLGLYFGWFFRPMREPSLYVVIGLSILITFVITMIRTWRRDRDRLMSRAASTWVNYAIVLSALEARHFAFDFGGRPAVIVMTTVLGALVGYRMALKDRQE